MSQNLLEALPDVEAKLAVAPAVLLAVDFDGALTPFVAHPDLARVSTPVKQKLQSLAQSRSLRVVLFSGRDRTDLSDRVGVPGLIYAGNHGLEISGPGFVFVEPSALAWQDALPALRHILTEQLRPIPGVLVEDKGLTVTVHLRQVSPDQHVEVRRAVYEALAGVRQPFRVEMAEKALEIRPRVEWTKAAALKWIGGQLQAPNARVVFISAEPNDEELIKANPEWISVKVTTQEEGNKTAAPYTLNGSTEVHEFLEWLREKEQVAKNGEEKPDKDEIEAASEQSFPASDPPSWTPVTAGPPAHTRGS